MQVGKAPGLLSLVAFSGLVAGPSWAGQFFAKMAEDGGEDGDKATNPEAKRQPPTYYTAKAEEPCESAGC